MLYNIYEHTNEIGVDTVRFIAMYGFDVEENPETGEIIYSINQHHHHKLHLVDGEYYPVFEFSYHAFYGLHGSVLGDQRFLIDLYDLYGARYKRLDLAIQLPEVASMLLLSYLRYYGRRSLQKKREPWAYWPGREKTIKFYDKQKQQKNEEERILYNEYPIRFEIEYRSRSISKVFDSSGFRLDTASFVKDFLHFYNQIEKVESLFMSGLEKKHYKAVQLFNEGAELNWKQSKDLRAALDLGVALL